MGAIVNTATSIQGATTQFLSLYSNNLKLNSILALDQGSKASPVVREIRSIGDGMMANNYS